jgi:hypothetical protein
MRNSIFFASALAASAAAMPWLDERAIVTRVHTATAIETVVVVVTATRGATSGSVRPSSTPVRSSSVVSQPTGIVAPIGGSATSSTSSRAATSSSSRAVSSSSVRVSSSVAAPTSISSSAAPSATPAQNGQTHLSGPQQAFLSSGVDYQNAILYHHNAARANHNAAPLVWNASCAANAQLAANMCNFAHYIPPNVANGQNLFTVSGSAFNVTAGITESWYKSEFPPMQPYFGQASLPDSVFHQVGHLTQVVWQGTTSVGCVSLDCGTRMKVNGQTSTLNKFTVCNYYPPGNIANRYDTGVLPPISTTNLGSWSD